MLKKLSKFGIIGLLNTVLDFLLFNIFTHTMQFFAPEFELRELTAQILCGLILVPVSFILNRRFTFNSNKRKRDTIAPFFAVSYFNALIVQSFVIWIWVSPLNNVGLFNFFVFCDNWTLYANSAKMCGVAVALMINFTAYHFIFSEKRA